MFFNILLALAFAFVGCFIFVVVIKPIWEKAQANRAKERFCQEIAALWLIDRVKASESLGRSIGVTLAEEVNTGKCAAWLLDCNRWDDEQWKGFAIAVNHVLPYANEEDVANAVAAMEKVFKEAKEIRAAAGLR